MVFLQNSSVYNNKEIGVLIKMSSILISLLFLNSACQRQKGVWTCCSSIWIKHVVCFINAYI